MATIDRAGERASPRPARYACEGGESFPHCKGDRLIIYLTDGRVVRKVNGKEETLTRRAGQVIWREHSQHQVRNAGAAGHEVLIVELK